MSEVKHIPLKDKYAQLQAEVLKELGLSNPMQYPRIEKIVINIGAGKAKEDNALMNELAETVGVITGQRPIITKTKEAISNFKLREGMPVGIKVTLRGSRMWFFLDKLISIALPRTKDFRGISPKSFDGKGNYSLGISDQTIFPEVDTTKNIRLHGLQVSIITTAGSDDAARTLLTKLGMPFKKQAVKNNSEEIKK